MRDDDDLFDDRTRSDGDQLLTFTLGEEEYGVPILRVQEVKGYSPLTPIPGTARHLRGVLNLRGLVVPVIDLRAKFGMPEVPYDKFTVIVIATVGARIVGLTVDAISDVLSVGEAELSPPPELGAQLDASYTTGLARVGEKVVLLLDIDALVASDGITPAAGHPRPTHS